MTIADSKRATDTSTKTKHAAEPISKPSTPKTVTVVRRPVVAQTSTGTKPTLEPDAEAKPTKLTYEKRMRELAPSVRLRSKLVSNAKRISKIVDEVSRWTNAPDLRAAAVSLGGALAAMLSVASAMPDTFQPERERKGSARNLQPGAKVTLRETAADKYEGVLAPEERAGLEVVSVSSAKRGRVVSVKTASGMRLVLPRAHVTRLAAEGERTAVPTSLSAPSETPATI